MNLKSLIVILVLIYAANAMAQDKCYIDLSDKILYAEKSKVIAEDVILSSDCDDEVQDEFIAELLDYTGLVPTSQFKTKFPKIKVHPSRVFIAPLAALMEEQLLNETKVVIRDLKCNRKNVFTLNKNDDIHFSTNNTLNRLGPTSVSMGVRRDGQYEEKFWFTANYKTSVAALVAKRALDRSSGALNFVNFEKKIVETDRPERLFTSFNRLSHFNLNRGITEGHILMKSETLPILLVNYGVPSNIELNSPSLKLSGTAIPLNSARFGEFVKLKNEKNNKIITGKVVDFNKVIIEL